jgi:choline dehydrogenase-like flavoprotein
MLRDCREIPDKSVLKTDICIVGAGPAGITLADALAANGHEVMLLEAGGEGLDPAAQELLSGEVDQVDYAIRSFPYPLHTALAKGIGGTSLRWNLKTGMARARPRSH